MNVFHGTNTPIPNKKNIKGTTISDAITGSCISGHENDE